MLKVSWKPADDAGRSAIDYIVTTKAGMDYKYSPSVKHPIISVPISGLPQYSAGTVSVWAKNLGALSKPVFLRFRMVSIVTNGIDSNYFATVYYCVYACVCVCAISNKIVSNIVSNIFDLNNEVI